MIPGSDPRTLMAHGGPVAMATPMPCAPGQMQMMTGMQHLAALPNIQVQEQANWLQELSAMIGMEVEMANKYKILDGANNQLYYAVEKTDCCRRQLQNGCCHDCAPYDVEILYTPPGQMNQLFLSISRPFQCTCCCLNRPTADVTDKLTGAKIGSFKDPFTIFGLKFHIRDAADNDVLLVDGGCCCCQPGMWCPLPCGPCSEVKFDVNDANGGHTVAKVWKKVPGCMTWCFAPDVDNYHVEFEQVANPQWKAILLAFTIFMDFRYFNINRNNEEAQRLRAEQQ
eukprot:TRINITY_DN91287_c0_g1_i1.p1 TRINITY_DN91287_c0_g1~~TRINITY_DN91287_c0_g1_i1.p1  ORF type:complete len:283 (+),score=61.95 TRINITY_DN91287_c0_g1_i1:85-933(+)